MSDSGDTHSPLGRASHFGTGVGGTGDIVGLAVGGIDIGVGGGSVAVGGTRLAVGDCRGTAVAATTTTVTTIGVGDSDSVCRF